MRLKNAYLKTHIFQNTRINLTRIFIETTRIKPTSHCTAGCLRLPHLQRDLQGRKMGQGTERCCLFHASLESSFKIDYIFIIIYRNCADKIRKQMLRKFN